MRGIGWGIGIFLVILVNSLVTPIQSYFENRSHPSAAKPEQAPYPVSVFSPSTVRATHLQEGDDGKTWAYTWELSTTSSIHDVLSYYDTVYPGALKAAETDFADEPRVIEYTPKGAAPNEKIRIVVGAEEGATSIAIEEDKLRGGWVPSRSTIKLFLWGMVVLLWFAFRANFAQLLAQVLMNQKMKAGGTKYERIEPPLSDPAVVGMWQRDEQALKEAGFSHLTDFRMHEKLTNYIRLLHNDNQTFASLLYIKPQSGAETACELFTGFNDGSTVTTNNSRFSGTFKRPPRFPLLSLPPATAVAELLARHQAAVDEHTGQARKPETVPSVDALWDWWKRVEREMHEFRKQSGFLSDKAEAQMRQTGNLVNPPQAPPPPPPMTPVAAPPQADDKVPFRTEVTEALARALPNVRITADGELMLRGETDHWRENIDLESLYYMCKSAPANKERMIASFVSNLSKSVR